MPILGSEKGWFYEGKMKDLSGWTIPGPGGSPTGSRRGFWRFSGELLDLRSGRKLMKIHEFDVFSWGKEGSAYIEPPRQKGFFAKLCVGALQEMV